MQKLETFVIQTFVVKVPKFERIFTKRGPNLYNIKYITVILVFQCKTPTIARVSVEIHD